MTEDVRVPIAKEAFDLIGQLVSLAAMHDQPLAKSIGGRLDRYIAAAPAGGGDQANNLTITMTVKDGDWTGTFEEWQKRPRSLPATAARWWATPAAQPEQLLEAYVVEALRFLLPRIGSWTDARWDQHLRHEFGDERAAPMIAALTAALAPHAAA